MAGKHFGRAAALGAAIAISLGVVVPRAWASVTPPSSVPTMAAPTDGGQVAGNVTLTALSTAPKLQFYVDTVAVGAPVDVLGGTATGLWPTFGLANGAAHAIAAADCNEGGCNATLSAASSVTIDNDAPALTSPAEGATAGRNPTLKATADGGAVQFFVDGAAVGIDTTLPYQLSVSNALSEGAHTFAAKGCNVAGDVCDGPQSAPQNFTVVALHPHFTSVKPNPFSPNLDGHNDTTKATFTLDHDEAVAWYVKNHDGNTVSGTHSMGPQAHGTRSFTWTGKDNAGHRVPDGTYTLVLKTTGKVGVVNTSGSTTATVKVDDTAPSVGTPNGNNLTFFPYPDGYADTFAPKVAVTEGGTLRLVINTLGGSHVRILTMTHSGSGTFSLSWNGRDSANRTVGAASYKYYFEAQDAAGNIRRSTVLNVHTSSKRLVDHVAVLTRNGDQHTELLSTDTSCTLASHADSTFAHGVWLANVCVSDFDVVIANYAFSAPGAVKYNSVQVSSYGNTISGPERLAATVYNFQSHKWEALGATSVNGTGNQWATFGGASAAATRVSSAHAIWIGIGVPNSDGVEDWDIGTVRVTLHYSLLQ